MKNQNISGYDLVQVCSSVNEAEKTVEKKIDLSEGTKRILLSIIDNFLLDISLETSKLTLYNLVNNNRSITMELFAQNIEEYISLVVSQSVTMSFSTGLENVIREFSEVLIKTQEGQIFNDSEPYDMKFQLKNGNEYWIDIKSFKYLNNSNKRTIEEHHELAEKEGKIYKLCLYDDENQSEVKYQLNGNDFWKLTADIDNAKFKIFNLINGAANKLSISTIIRDTKTRFIREWRMQD